MRKILILFLMGILVGGCSSKEKAEDNDSGNSTEMASSKNGSQDPNWEIAKQKLIKEGMTRLNKAEIPEAVKIFTQAIKLDPKDTRPYFILAETYMHLQNFDNSINMLDDVIKLEPQNGHAYYMKALASGLAGKKSQALESVQKSVMIFKESQDEGNFKRSLALLQELSTQLPGGANALTEKSGTSAIKD